MISFLLIISFLLHIVTLYAIFLLYKQHQSYKKEDVSEITNLFEEYINQIKEENHRLQKELERETPLNKMNRHSSAEKTRKIYEVPTESMEEPVVNAENITDSMEASIEAKVLQLYHEGQSVNEIAKKLNCGKTEAELIINLHEKVSK